MNVFRRRWILYSLLLTISVATTFFLILRSSETPTPYYELERVGQPDVASSFAPHNRDDAVARSTYEYRRLRNPETGAIPRNMRQRELMHASQLPVREFHLSKQANTTWVPRGPYNVGGRTRALAIDLDFDDKANPRILAGGISGGVFISENDGVSWRLATGLNDLASVTCIVQDPQNREVWYHGTGESLGNSAGAAGAQHNGQGVFKSTDRGETWQQLASTVQDNQLTSFDSVWDRVWNMAVHPQTGDVYAAILGFIVRSQDGGDSWDSVLGPSEQPFSEVTDIAIASNGTLYATLSRSGSNVTPFGVYQSTNNGDTWFDITPNNLGGDPWRMVVRPAPSDPNSVYLIAQINQQGAVAADHRFYRLDVGAGNWTDLSAGLPNVETPDNRGNEPREGNASFSSQGGYDLMLAVKPDDPDVVWIGGTNLYRSLDGGQTFTLVGGYASPYNYSLYETHHPDQHAIAFYPDDPNGMISGHDGGLSKTKNVLEDPQTWTSLNNGYLTSQFYTISIDPSPGSETIIGGLQDNGVWSTFTSDSKRPWISEIGGDGAFTAIAPGGLPYYVSTQFGNVIRVSLVSNQLAYSLVAPAGAQDFMFITPFLLDPNDARIMYIAAGNVVWRNSNLDAIPPGNAQLPQTNWSALTGSAIPNTWVTALSVSKSPANRLFFGATDFGQTTRIIRVDSPESNGQGVDVTPLGTTPGSYASSIGINPDNADEVVVTYSNYGIPRLWHTEDGGSTWTNVDGNLGGDDGPSMAWALIMPAQEGTIYYLATSTGVYSTTQLAAANTVWVREADDVIGNVNTDMIVGRPEDGLVVAATHGRGVYSTNVTGTTGNAVAALDVDRVDFSARPGETPSQTITLQNTGSIALNYAIVVDQPILQSQARTGVLSGLRTADAPAAVRRRAMADGQPRQSGAAAGARVHHDSPSSVQLGEDAIIYDDGNDASDDFWGWGDGETGLFWGNSFFVTTDDFSLERFEFFMRTESATSNPIWVSVYDAEGNSLANGTLEFAVSPDGDWYTVTLNNPLRFEQNEQFFIEIGADGSIAFPAGVDADAAVAGRSFYAQLNEEYINLNTATESGFDEGAFLVRAIGTAGVEEENLPPVIDAVVTTFSATVGETITFDASASSDPDGQIDTYLWDFGDGTTSNQAVAQHSYDAVGIYGISITITDNDGATAEASELITVSGQANAAPMAVLDASTTQVALGESITFNASRSSDSDGTVVAYLWNFGDGVESDQEVTQHAYQIAGTYLVSLTVTDDQDATGQSSVEIDVADADARLTVSSASGSIPAGGSSTLTLSYDTEGLEEGTYESEVRISTNGGSFVLPVSVLVSQTVAVEDEHTGLAALRLAQNYPNPFTHDTVIPFELQASSHVTLEVYDVAGRRIRRLADGIHATGSHQVRWDGTDEGGSPVGSGIYLYRLLVAEGSGTSSTQRTGKMTRVR